MYLPVQHFQDLEIVAQREKHQKSSCLCTNIYITHACTNIHTRERIDTHTHTETDRHKHRQTYTDRHTQTETYNQMSNHMMCTLCEPTHSTYTNIHPPLLKQHEKTKQRHYLEVGHKYSYPCPHLLVDVHRCEIVHPLCEDVCAVLFLEHGLGQPHRVLPLTVGLQVSTCVLLLVHQTQQLHSICTHQRGCQKT